jgi:uncharacterized membrane protein YebE (DUF533 family)
MLLKLAALGAVGYAGYKYYEKNRVDENGVAFASGQPSGSVRDSGPRATPTGEKNWSKTDEEIDESFPASDPPANY